MACASKIDTRTWPETPSAWLLDDGRRLHLQQGPIDLIVDAVGGAGQVRIAYEQAHAAFLSILDDLANQLPRLRQRLTQQTEVSAFDGDVAQRMTRAAKPFADYRVTPMIAVAGAVADHVLCAMVAGRTLERAQVNNGGDIALYLSGNACCSVGICTAPDSSAHSDVISIARRDGVGGIATSGWQGRSFSLGIANAVTVLATDAATADATATLIANATDLPGSGKIKRKPAVSLAPDSDLGDRAVTVSVANLSEKEIETALDSGARLAEQFCADHLIISAYLNVQGTSRVIRSDTSDGPLQNRSPLAVARMDLIREPIRELEHINL